MELQKNKRFETGKGFIFNSYNVMNPCVRMIVSSIYPVAPSTTTQKQSYRSWLEGARTLRDILTEKWGFQQSVVGVDIELRIHSA